MSEAPIIQNEVESGPWTPGPWGASAPDGSYHDVIRIFAQADPAGALPVAVCPQRQSAIMSVFSGQTNETTEAASNARLIAAAPELYEALATIERHLTARMPGDPLAALAQAALSKARGELR